MLVEYIVAIKIPYHIKISGEHIINQLERAIGPLLIQCLKMLLIYLYKLILSQGICLKTYLSYVSVFNVLKKVMVVFGPYEIGSIELRDFRYVMNVYYVSCT